jgi:hypothetical protein
MRKASTAAILRVLSPALTLVLCRATITSAQEAAIDPKVVERIQEGDDGALSTIGASRNPGYAPYLLELQRRYVPDLLEPEARLYAFDYVIALARVDSPAGQQFLWCRSIAGSQTTKISGRFRNVGGWFGIRALMTISEATEGDGGAYFASKGAWPLGEYARAELSAMLPEAAIPIDFTLKSMTGVTPQEAASQLRLRWREWVLTHDAELRAREPRGEQVELSTTGCDVKRGLPSPRFSFGIDWSPEASK